MTFTDPIGDMFSRIRTANALAKFCGNTIVKFRKNILEILKNEGYIKDYFIEKLKIIRQV